MNYASSLAIIGLGLILSQAPAGAVETANGQPVTANPVDQAAAPVARKASREPVRAIPPAPQTAAPRDEELEITTNLPAGARYELDITLIHRRVRDGITNFAVTVEYKVDLVVSQVTGGDAVLELTYGAATVKDTDDSLEARLGITAHKMFIGQKVLYRTAGGGAVTGLVNSEEFEAVLNGLFDRLLRDADREADNPMTVAGLRAGFDPLRHGPAMEKTALELPNLIHFFSGLTLDAGKRYSRSDTMLLGASGAMVPSKLNYNLAWFDRTSGIAWLSWSQTADPGRTAEAVESFTRDLFENAGQPLPRGFDFGPSSATKGAIYELDLETGLPKRIAYFSGVAMLGFSTHQEMQIRILH